MRATASLGRFRARAESRMESRVLVRRPVGRGPLNDATGLETRQWETVHTDLPFRLDGSGNSDGGSRTLTVAGVEHTEPTAVGHFPATTEDLQDNDVALITAGEWTGTYWRFVEAMKGDQKTARRIPIVGVDRPEGWT